MLEHSCRKYSRSFWGGYPYNSQISGSMSVGGPPSQVDSRIGQWARAHSSISKPVVPFDTTIQPLAATPANVPREDRPSRWFEAPLPPFAGGPPLPFELPAYANWL